MTNEQIYNKLEEIQEKIRGVLFCIACNKNNLDSLTTIELMVENIKNNISYLYTELEN